MCMFTDGAKILQKIKDVGDCNELLEDLNELSKKIKMEFNNVSYSEYG